MALKKSDKQLIDLVAPTGLTAVAGYMAFKRSNDWRFITAVIVITFILVYIITSQVTKRFYLAGPAEVPTGAGAENYNALPLTQKLYDDIYAVFSFRQEAPYRELLALSDAQFIAVYNMWNRTYYEKDQETLPKAIAGENSGLFTEFKGLQSSLARRFQTLNLQ